jgi:hypothetical protein
MAATWTDLREHDLTPDSLDDLLANRIPAIRIRNFATPEECASFTASAKAGNMKFYSVAKRIGYIGMAQYEYRWNRPMSDFFDAVPGAKADLQWVVDRSFDPVRRLVGALQAVYDAPIGPAREKQFGEYFAGIIRMASEGVDLHADFAPFNSPAYSIGRIDSQLAWNFFAEELLSGGETTIYNEPWTPEMKPGEIPKSYGLDPAIVAGSQAFTYKPTAGDVVLFNSRNPHQVGGGQTLPGRDRISIGSFIGRMPDRSLVMWA